MNQKSDHGSFRLPVPPFHSDEYEYESRVEELMGHEYCIILYCTSPLSVSRVDNILLDQHLQLFEGHLPY